MDKESVDSMFKDYQGCKARCRYLEACILKAEAELEEMRLTIIEDNIHITASLTGLPGRQKVAQILPGIWAIKLLEDGNQSK